MFMLNWVLLGCTVLNLHPIDSPGCSKVCGRSEGFPRTGYFVPACVGSGRCADFESCSHIHACGFRCFCRKVWFRARGEHIYRKSVVSCKRAHIHRKSMDSCKTWHEVPAIPASADRSEGCNYTEYAENAEMNIIKKVTEVCIYIYVYIMRTRRMCFPTARLFCTRQRICWGPALVYLIYLGSDLVFLQGFLLYLTN